MEKATERDVVLLLRDYFKAPEYVLLPQLRNGTGFERAARTADAVAMGVWPSRGLYLHGIEIKVSRGDWLHEKKSPEKAEEISRFCDFWYLAVSDAAIVLDGEVPATWGLLAPGKNGKLALLKKPEKLQPQPITSVFLASILRNTAESAGLFTEIDAEVERRVKKLAAEKEKDAVRIAEQNVKFKLQNAERLEASVKAFEEESGIKIDRYSDYFSREIGQAVKAIRDAGSDLQVLKRMQAVENEMKRYAAQIAEQRAALEAAWNA